MIEEKIRNDITGLRALAVIPVLLFHAKIPFVPGGFLGVDLFFFISGYLITGDIIRKLEKNKFSFINFYDRRARRILPALLLAILSTAIIAPFFMVPYDIKNLGQSILASTFASNNILLFLTSGYWSHAAEFKPLYHTWSLGVEEQYYFIVPIIFTVLVKLFKKTEVIIYAIIFLLAVSITHSYIAVNKEYNFLLLPTRAWELMAGGVLSYYTIKNKSQSNNILSIVGLGIIILSYVNPELFDKNQVLTNITPIVGAYLIIKFSNEESTLVGKILSSKHLVFIGLISYSVYLWHQPLIAFYRLASEYEPEPYRLAAISFISIPLGYLSWRFIENPARDSKKTPPKIFYSFIGCTLLLTASLGLMMHKTYGFQEYFQEYSYEGDPQAYVDLAYQYTTPSEYSDKKERLVILGNSFARDFINIIQESELKNSYEIFYEPAGCKIHEERLNKILGNSNYVILSSDWGNSKSSNPEAEFADLQNCAENLKKHIGERRLYIIGTKNFGWNNNFVKKLSNEEIFTARTKPNKFVRQFNELAAKNMPEYIDILSLISDTHGNVPVFSNEKKFITYDTNHLTKSGAKYLSQIIFENTKLVELKKSSSNITNYN